ncbi:ABC transporter permease [Geotoga petraea]|jgi:ABC-2 type transport system permease protein|uniref:ABC-2 type transport system permease protein n=2 Tax=Geotoga petraea TaxID=28234 RepID=A0A1G6NVL1_9BACT|nr:ABC transporter permease [Geotoga petraea]SDC71195.1 ABC-2 type transport system permease protein [Geotoga petraea]
MMIEIFYLVKKDLKIRSKYKSIWLNMALTPFFMISPYVFSTKLIGTESLSQEVLIGTLLWYWLTQYFFGVGDGFGEERMEGTLVTIIISPVKLSTFLFAKGFDTLIMNLYLSFFTFLFFIFNGIKINNIVPIFVLLLISGLYITFFSFFYAALALWKRRINSINTTIQYFLGVFSGMTTDIGLFPIYLKAISYIIPLSYLISIGRNIINSNFSNNIISFLILNIVSFTYLFLGLYLLKKVENQTRKSGGWESW